MPPRHNAKTGEHVVFAQEVFAPVIDYLLGNSFIRLYLRRLRYLDLRHFYLLGPYCRGHLCRLFRCRVCKLRARGQWHQRPAGRRPSYRFRRRGAILSR